MNSPGLGICATEIISTAKAPQRSIFSFFIVSYARYAPLNNEKPAALWRFFATDISAAQTPDY
jgi:hypothetical protein